MTEKRWIVLQEIAEEGDGSGLRELVAELRSAYKALETIGRNVDPECSQATCGGGCDSPRTALGALPREIADRIALERGCK